MADLKTLVERSYLLSDAQRRYWVQQLPLMNDVQKARLNQILGGTDELPFQKELEKYLVAMGNAALKLSGALPA